MIQITGIQGTTVHLLCEELGTTVSKQLSDFEFQTNATYNYVSLKINIDPYSQEFIIYLPKLEYQELWRAYINNVKSLPQTQTMATDRGLPTSGKSQDQLAKDIISFECVSRDMAFLLQ